MRKIFLVIIFLISTTSFSQIAIGKTNVDGKGILDFGNDGNKGIILPIADISDQSLTYTNGTFLVDYSSKIVKVFQNDIWLNLSDEGSFETQFDLNNPTESITSAVSFNPSDEVGTGVVIGDINEDGNAISGAEGILVLESNDHALILPKVTDPHLNIPSPVAGTICYDLTSDSLAIFDGKVWNYWK